MVVECLKTWSKIGMVVLLPVTTKQDVFMETANTLYRSPTSEICEKKYSFSYDVTQECNIWSDNQISFKIKITGKVVRA